MAQTIPADSHVVGDAAHTADHNNIADMLGLISSVLVQATGNPNLSAAPPAAAAVAALQSAFSGQTLDDSRDFHPEAYGANVGDGKMVTDGAMSSSVSPTTLTCATSSPFVPGDVGKYALVQNAGSATLAGNTLVAQVTAYISASQVTLSAPALATVSGAYVIWGTDSTAAINAAVAAAYSYAVAGPMEAVVQFLPKIYVVAGNPIQGGTALANAQIPFPFRSMSLPKVTILFEGIPDTPLIHFGLNSTPIVAGAAVVCASTAGSNNGTYGPASVFGGYTHEQGAGDSVFSNFRPIFQGITVVTPYNGVFSGVDCYGTVGMGIRSLSCVAFAAPGQLANPTVNISVANRWTFGLRTPTTSNDGNPFIDNYVAYGYGYGCAMSEHVSASRGFTLYNVVGLGVFSTTNGSPMLHCSRVHYWCCEANNIQLGAMYSADPVNIDIGTLDIDSGASSTPYSISDPNSLIKGEVILRGASSTYTFNGGMAKLRVIDGDRVPGHVASPGVPGSATPYVNNVFLRDAAVTIATGAGVTVSVITIDGTVSGATLAASSSTTVIVPTGKAIALTYAGGTPAWTWVLM